MKKKIKKFILLILILLFLPFNFLFAEDTLYVEKNLIFSNGYTNDHDLIHLDSIKDSKYFFDGYLVIGNNKNINQKDSDYWISKIFWVDSLNHINNIGLSFFYYPLIDLSLQRMIHYEPKSKQFNYLRNFAYFYWLFNETNEKDFSTYLFKFNESIKTNILTDEISTWQFIDNDTSGLIYNVFKCSFYTAIIYSEMNMKLIDGIDLHNVKTFVPISKLLEFRQITNNEAKEFGLIKSNTLIRLR